MKMLKRIFGLLLTAGMICCFAGCSLDILDNDIAATVNSSVTMPEQYSITYEIETTEGTIHTVKKALDSDGNIYFKSGSTELLFMKGDKHYTLYEKNADGQFVSSDSAEGYNLTYVEEATSEFSNYAQKSKNQFLPGMNSDGEKEFLGRTCLTYSIHVGAENIGVTYTFLVDEETGICLGWEEAQKVADFDLGADGEIFECTQFITEGVPSLEELIAD